MVDLCGVLPCDTTKNYCISGVCIDKNYVYYGIVGVVLMMILLTKPKRRE